MASLYPQAIALADAIAAQETEDAGLIYDLTGELETAKAQLAVANGNVETQAATIRSLLAKITVLEQTIADLNAPPVVTPPTPPATATVIYGPKGTAWPTNTPRSGVGTDVACTWAAIGTAITNLPDGSVINVLDGTLPGYGAGSVEKTVLANVGKANRAQRVLVRPKNPGGVKFSKSIRLDGIKSVSFVGFDMGTEFGVVITGNSSDFAWARSYSAFFNLTAGTGTIIQRGQYIDCVAPVGRLFDGDRCAYRTVGTGKILDIQLLDSYLAPTFNSASNPTAHTDTLQCSGDGPIERLTIRGSVIFASTNAGFIGSSLAKDVTFDKTLVVGSRVLTVRYPVPAGAEALPTNPEPVAINGGIVNLRILDSVAIGKLASPTVADASGSVGTDLRLGKPAPAITTDYLNRVAPLPTPTTLKQIWS